MITASIVLLVLAEFTAALSSATGVAGVIVLDEPRPAELGRHLRLASFSTVGHCIAVWYCCDAGQRCRRHTRPVRVSLLRA